MPNLTLATDRSLLDLDARYRSLFAEQQGRMGPPLASLTDDQWQAPSRNRDWTVQQTLQHVAGVRMENVRVLDGLERQWSGAFDPNRTPQEDIDNRAGESPAETLVGFHDATRRLLMHLADRSMSDERRPMLWGEDADFRLFFVHVFWDSLVHERDIFLALDLDHEPDAEAMTFATAYGLLIAGVAIRMGGGEIDTHIAVDGLGWTSLSVAPDAVRAHVDPDVPRDSPNRASDAGALIDALSGRGEVGAALEAAPDVVAALSGFAAFLRG